jgi:hypothetical protein
MRSRSLRSTRQNILDSVNQVPREKVSQAFIVGVMPGTAREVLIQFADPRLSRGATIKATVSMPIAVNDLPVGTPVTVSIRHGQVQIVGLPAQTPFVGSGSVLTSSLIDNAGDLLYGLSDNNIGVLGVGSAGQFLRVNPTTGLVEWASAYYPGGTDVAVVDGGTGASTGATALANLGLQAVSVGGWTSIAAAGSQEQTCTWGAAWADTTYKCVGNAFINGNCAVSFRSKTVNDVLVKIWNNGTGAVTPSACFVFGLGVV